MAKRGMGRGLAAILPDKEQAADELRMVPPELVVPNPAQPRRTFDPESIEALRESIEAAGMVQPLVVRPLDDGRYELIAGERRWRAASQAQIAEVPVVVRDADEAERMKTALIENMAREDLNPVDEARACVALVEDLGLSRDELATLVGRSRPAISNLIRLLDLPDEALELLEARRISEGHGRAILKARGAQRREELAQRAAEEGWSVRETERRATEATERRSRKSRPEPHPDALEAAQRGEDALEAALGREVRVRPTTAGGLRAELGFDDIDELLEFARTRD